MSFFLTMKIAVTQSLGFRFSLVMILVVTLIISGFSVALIMESANQLNTELQNRVAVITNLTAMSLSLPLWDYNFKQMNDFVEALFRDQAIVYAGVLLEDELVAENIHPEMAQHDWSYFESAPRQFLITVSDVLREGKKLGSLRIAVSKRHIQQALTLRITFIIVLTIVLILAISLTSILITRRHILRPLTHLVDSATAIADGDVTVSLHEGLKLKHSNDELGVLTRVFERMVNYLSNMAAAATNIATGDVRQEITPLSARDVLGNAFQQMTAYLCRLATAATAIAGGNLKQEVHPVTEHDVLGNAFSTMAHQLDESFTRQQQLLHELESLNALGQALTSRLDVEHVIDEIYRGASRLLDTTNFYLMLYEAEHQQLSFALRVADGQVERPAHLQPGYEAGLTEYVLTQKSALLLPDQVDARLADLGIQTQPIDPGRPAVCWLGVPIIAGEQVLGTMAVQSHTTPGLYTEHDQDVLAAIASQAAIAIENARLFEQAQQELTERKRAQDALRQLNEELEERVKARTAELAQANAEIRVLNEQLQDENLRMKTEMELARRIQTSLLPQLVKNVHPDFEIAAIMLPADEVGGDYYDIALDWEGNLWFGIGDVSGHGVTPGLIMMMAQTVHTAITTNYQASPREVVIGVNNVLYKNVRNRLEADHFMTFTTLKYLGEGQFHHAGAHLDLIIHRRQTERCELIDTPGTWLNFIPDVTNATQNSAFTLDVGDTLVLYTDGLTEAWSPEKELLDVPRFLEIIRHHAVKNTEAMRDAILADVLTWCEDKRADDMSLVVVRRVQ